jgi:DNA-binding PadR family transcriptional regulator
MIGKGHAYKGNRISPMQLSLLVLLGRRPMYGYELLKILRDRFEGVWSPKTGSIYPALKRLEEHGLIISSPKDDKDYYSLTEEGRAWVLEVVCSNGTDMLFLSRYLQLLGESVSELRREGEVPVTSHFPSFSAMFEDAAPQGEERKTRLLEARDRLRTALARVEQELATLDDDQKKGGNQ